ncbi:hypothetical protein DKX38_019821 [Salix brachista]|uniref:Pentatricopeptide repeat-containing protein n=1 Tax=Salix brachista TaxID=2182728 RepID=A0A5N5KHG8_9ROSI|nr:hypothetical protein DKX38_019821 [Salix brachista]
MTLQEAPINKCQVIIKQEHFKSFNNLKTVRSRGIEYAHQLFDEMPEPNVVSWTSLISGYVNMGRPQFPLWLYTNLLTFDFFSFFRSSPLTSGPKYSSSTTQGNLKTLCHQVSTDLCCMFPTMMKLFKT